MGADRKATIEVVADVNKAVKNFQSLESRFQKLTRQMARDIEKVDFDPTSESAVQLREEIRKTGDELVAFGEDGDKATDELKRDLKGLDDQFDSLGVRTKKAGLNIGKMGVAIAAAAAAAAAFVAIQIGRKLAELARDALKVNVAFDSIRASFLAAEQAGADASAEFAFAREVANELGLEVETLTGTYAGFLNAAIRSNLTVEQSRSIFLGVSTAARALGLSTEALEGSLLAVQQIASKGTLSLEELTGQLGERIPGVLPLLAAKLDLTTGELTRMVAAGKLLAVDVLPQLGEALQEAFGDAAEAQIDKYQATMQRLANTLSEAQDQFAKGFVDDFVEAINKATEANFNLAKAARVTGEVLGFLISVAAPLANTLSAVDSAMRETMKGSSLAAIAIGLLTLQMTNAASAAAAMVPGLGGLSEVIEGVRANAVRLSAEGFKAIADSAADVGDSFGGIGLALGQAQADLARANAEFIQLEETQRKAKEALDKLQKGLGDEADAADKAGAATEGFANTLESAAGSTKKLADETERNLSLFDQIAERLKDAAKEAAELEKQEAKAGRSSRDLGKSAAELREEYDALTGQYALTVEETNRLSEVSFELGSAQGEVAESAKDAADQVHFFGAGTADAAADVDALAAAATLGSDNIFGLSESTADAIGRLALFGDETDRARTSEEKLIETVKKLVESLETLKEATVGGFKDGIEGANSYLAVMTKIVAKFNELKECADEFSKDKAA